MDTLLSQKEIRMMNMSKSIIAALCMTVLLLMLSGCQQGPAERAGKKVDNTVEKGKQKVEKVGKEIKEDVKGK
jgi:hypothetical protein